MGHWPVLSGCQPDSRTQRVRTQWCAISVRSAGRQVAAQNGQVGRSPWINYIVPAKG